MTSTEFTVGLDGKRVSSKVLKPPGGGSSDIFNLQSSEKESTKSRLFGNVPKSNIIGSTPQKSNYVIRNPITGEGVADSDGKKPIEKENVDEETEVEKDMETKPKPEPEERKIVPTIRVRNPPGGKSSGIF